jgi:hypothetical protein
MPHRAKYSRGAGMVPEVMHRKINRLREPDAWIRRLGPPPLGPAISERRARLSRSARRDCHEIAAVKLGAGTRILKQRCKPGHLH